MDSFIGEIRIFGFAFAPENWAFCNGQVLPIQQNPVLYSVIGSTYGGDQRSNFALPNLQGLAVMGAGAGPGLTPRKVGGVVGEPSVTLNSGQMPIHGHTVNASPGNPSPSNANMAATPGANTLAARKIRKGSDGKLYVSKSFSANVGQSTAVELHPSTIGVAGASSAHENRQPYLTMNYCISLYGEFPQRQ